MYGSLLWLNNRTEWIDLNDIGEERPACPVNTVATTAAVRVVPLQDRDDDDEVFYSQSFSTARTSSGIFHTC